MIFPLCGVTQRDWQTIASLGLCDDFSTVNCSLIKENERDEKRTQKKTKLGTLVPLQKIV
jgi:hypothetical protein